MKSSTVNRKIVELYDKYGIFSILVGTFIISTFLSPVFLTQANILNVIRQNVTIGIVACGAQLVLISGEVDLSPGAVAAFSGCIAAMVASSTGNPVLAFFTCLLLGATIGLVNGIFITGFKLPAFIMTLATQAVAKGGILAITRARAVSGLGNFSWIGQGYIGPFPVPILLWCVILLICGFILNKMRFGRHIYAVGGNRAAARASGIRQNRVVMKCFIIAGALSGLAGGVLMARIDSGQPTSGVGLEFDAITATIIGGTSMYGGRGNIYGTIAGTLFVGILTNIMTLVGVNAYTKQMAQGIIIALAVLIDVTVKKQER
ncbi:MAG: ABC transporter permease [Oscillospiraceae bacterium]|nr:ABC transporter permease [Oscillospiraceae bacterium]